MQPPQPQIRNPASGPTTHETRQISEPVYWHAKSEKGVKVRVPHTKPRHHRKLCVLGSSMHLGARVLAEAWQLETGSKKI